MPVAGNDGACCDCGEFASLGCGCGGGVPCSLTCRSKSGTANFCGYSEYTDPSDPPKFYRRQDLDAEFRACVSFTGGGCSGNSNNQYRKKWSGSYSINKDTCEATNTQKLATYVTDPAPCSFADGVFAGDSTVPMDGGTICTVSAETTETQTRVDYNLDVTCDGVPSEGTGNFNGGGNKQLSDEDTEDDAENRGAASILDWSPCTSGCLVSCSAFRTDRSGTSDDFFGYRKVQTKLQWGATVGRTYHLRINFGRRLLGSGGPFLDLGMPWESTVVAGVISESTDWVDVPNEAGWETVAASCVVTLQPE